MYVLGGSRAARLEVVMVVVKIKEVIAGFLEYEELACDCQLSGLLSGLLLDIQSKLRY